jgi:hypothetical protein
MRGDKHQVVAWRRSDRCFLHHETGVEGNSGVSELPHVSAVRLVVSNSASLEVSLQARTAQLWSRDGARYREGIIAACSGCDASLNAAELPAALPMARRILFIFHFGSLSVGPLNCICIS